MPSSSSFSGAPLSVLSAEQVSASVLRVRYATDPLAASSVGVNDALNKANYAITGPAVLTITNIGVVGGDPQAVDITMSAPLVAGTWLVSVSNVQTASGNPLVAPTAASFNALPLPTAPALSQGADNDDAESLMRKYLSSALKGRGWDALLAALSTGDTYRNDTAKSAFDQLFKSTASGIYLDRRAADDGLTRPPNIGLDDEVFRKIAIKTTAFKQIDQVMLEALEAYYGSEATRAYAQSSVAEPFALADGDTLVIQTESGDRHTVVLEDDDFNSISAAKALEVAAAINRTLRLNGSNAYAVSYLDPSTQLTYVRIFSGSLGLRGYVRIYGGRVQNVLKFPKAVHTSVTGPLATTQFTIIAGNGINGVASGRTRFTFAGGAAPTLQDVLEGDYVNIYGSVFDEELRGIYTVMAVTSAYVEIASSSLSWPASVTLTDGSDFRFYRPSKNTLTASRMATVTQGDPSQLDVILPATTQAITRTVNSGAYLHVGEDYALSTAVRDANGLVIVTTTAPHGLTGDHWAFIDGVYPTIQSLTVGWSDGDATNNSLTKFDAASCTLADGRVLHCGGWDGGAAVSTARLYTPSTNTWATIPSMARTRRGHTLTLLSNGKVLCVGGRTADKTAELYDPTSNTWTDTGDTISAQEWHGAARLNDGRVFVFGVDAEVYDPGTGTWALTAQPTVATRSYHTVTKLNDGRVLIAGGVNAYPTGLSSAEVYNPVNDTWQSTGAMGGQRWGHAAVHLSGGTSGKVMVIGGSATGGVTDLATAELFNPATMSWSAAASMTDARFEPAACVMSDGRVFVCGGFDDVTPAFRHTTEIYDPRSNLWSSAATMATDRYSHEAVALTGKVIVMGGEPASQAELFTFSGSAINGGKLNDLVKITVTGASTFTYSTPDAPYATTCAGGTMTLVEAVTDDISGPFIYDPQAGVAVTGVATTSTMDLIEGQNYNVLTVAAGGATDFPDEEGFICIGFGTETQVAPIRYLARLSSNQLLLDPSFIFPKTVSSGATVTLLKQRGVWEPAVPEEAGTFYLTAAAAGRVAASNTIDDLAAAGVTVVKTVVYPSDVGLGNEGQLASGTDKISDKVVVWGGDELDSEIAGARE